MKPSVKYVAIHANKEKYGIAFMCQYFGVSRSGYYAWMKRRDKTDKDEALLKEQHKALIVAKTNIVSILGIDQNSQEHNGSREQKRNDSHYR